MNEHREREKVERERVALPDTEGHITVRSLKSNFSWLKLFLEVKIRHATHWDRGASYSLHRIYLDATTKAGRHITYYRYI